MIIIIVNKVSALSPTLLHGLYELSKNNIAICIKILKMEQIFNSEIHPKGSHGSFQ